MSSPKSIKGSIGEHKMIVDLLGKGYHVAKAVDPQCPFDLVAVTPTGEIKLIDLNTNRFSIVNHNLNFLEHYKFFFFALKIFH